MCVKGSWGSDKIPCAIVNIYSPCDLQGKHGLWSSLLNLLEQDPNRCWCFAGDFNAVCRKEERNGSGVSNSRSERRKFRDFIESNGLVDLPLLGRKFTWYKPGALVMSRIDRFLLSDTWIQKFSNLVQWGAKRTVSDQCPLILKGGELDWGPKPFRVLHCWNEHPEFISFCAGEVES